MRRHHCSGCAAAGGVAAEQHVMDSTTERLKTKCHSLSTPCDRMPSHLPLSSTLQNYKDVMVVGIEINSSQQAIHVSEDKP